jgi:hypothetical protein
MARALAALRRFATMIAPLLAPLIAMLAALLIVNSLTPLATQAQSSSATGSPATAGSVSGGKPLDVRGQSRMQGIIQTKEDGVEIDFVKPRKDFREEILKTSY